MRMRLDENHAISLGSLRGLVIAASLLACDPFEYVYLTNRAAEPVSLYEITRTPESLTRLAPGETRRRNWRYPIDATDLRRVRVEADGSGGKRIFCHDFSYEDLRSVNWRIDITPGRDDCK
jgi:hypothetical protein